MGKLILKTIILILPFLFIIIWWERGLRQVPTNYSVKRGCFELQKKDVQTLILGSSHAFHGINPRYFSSKAFNLAYASQSLYYDYALLEKYIDSMPHLKTVYLEVSYFSMEYSLMDIDEDWRSMFYYHAYGIPTERNKLNWDIRKISLIQLYKKDQAMAYIFSGFKNAEVTLQKNGWDALGSGGSCTSGPSRAKFHTSIMHPDNITSNVRYIENIALTLKKRGIRLILVSPPICKSYFSNIDKKRYTNDQKAVQSIVHKYNIKYLNDMQDPNFTDQDFIDSDHLSIKGAKKFTEILNKMHD